MLKVKRGLITVFEILILLTAIFAIAYIISKEIKIVSATIYSDGQRWSNGLGDIWQRKDGVWSYMGNTPSLKDRTFNDDQISGFGGKFLREEQSPPSTAVEPVGAAAVPALASTYNAATDITTLLKGAKIVDGSYVSGTIGKFTATAANPVVASSGGTIIKQGSEIATYNTGLTAAEDVGLKGQITPPAGASSSGGMFDWVGNIYGGTAFGGGLIGGIVSTAAWGLTVYYGVKMLGGMFGFSEKQVNSAAMALGWGVAAGRATYFLVNKGYLSSWGLKASSAATTGFVVGVVVAIAVYLLTYKSESTKTVTFQCLPWEAPTVKDKAKCEVCNTDPIRPCSEYRCKALGQGCEIINLGTAEERCAWVNENDVARPIIKAWQDILLPDYRYNANAIQPPDVGVKVEYTKSTDGCVKAFTPLTFGITANKPVQCKIDYNRPAAGKVGYDAMQFFMGGSNLYRYNHSEVLSLPGPSAVQNGTPTLPSEQGDYSLYVKCQDAVGLINQQQYGRANEESFVFKFCVEKGPDLTEPLIVTTSLLNNMPVSYNQTSLNLDVYVNEPSECKWSRNDVSYNDMETQMQCTSSVFEMNAQLLYKCSTTLTGIKQEQANDYYFKCKDQPGALEENRNVNKDSYNFRVYGTKNLNIISVGPNGTIKDATDVVAVKLEAETANGFQDGNATCYYSPTDVADNYIAFRNTNSYVHSQQLNLPSGDYKYYIKCLDLGGNADKKTVEFRVETDTEAPTVVRIYHEGTKLKLVTNEEAICGYTQQDNIGCNFLINQSIKFRTDVEVEHVADWNVDKTYYIRCQDQYGNSPDNGVCNVVVRPFELYKTATTRINSSLLIA